LANSTCFDQKLLIEIAKKCQGLKVGDWVFTLTKKLPSNFEEEESGEETEEIHTPDWECVMSIKREMSWGLATVHLQRKIR
jgi:hypothetical protein